MHRRGPLFRAAMGSLQSLLAQEQQDKRHQLAFKIRSEAMGRGGPQSRMGHSVRHNNFGLSLQSSEADEQLQARAGVEQTPPIQGALQHSVLSVRSSAMKIVLGASLVWATSQREWPARRDDAHSAL